MPRGWTTTGRRPGRQRVRLGYGFGFRGLGGVASQAPFATGGASVTVAATTLYGFDADGKAAAIGAAGGRIGVAGGGDATTIDHDGGGSEMIGLDFGAAIDAITLRPRRAREQGRRPRGRDARRLRRRRRRGRQLDLHRQRRGDRRLRRAGPRRPLEAADWIGGAGPAHSDPDFVLVGIGLDYV